MTKWIELTREMATDFENLILEYWGDDQPRIHVYYNEKNGDTAAVASGDEQWFKSADGWRCAIGDANDPDTWGDETDTPDDGILADLMMMNWKDEIEAAINEAE